MRPSWIFESERNTLKSGAIKANAEEGREYL